MQREPAYVLHELSKIESDQRLHETMQNVVRYYTEAGIALSPYMGELENLPTTYTFGKEEEYRILRNKLGRIEFKKLPSEEADKNTQPYRQLAADTALQTVQFLKTYSS